MTVNLKQVLVGIALLAGLLGIAMAVWDERWSEVAILGILVTASILLYVTMLDRNVAKAHWAIASSRRRLTFVIAAIVGMLVALIWNLST